MVLALKVFARPCLPFLPCVRMYRTQGFGGVGKPFHRRYVVSQAVQIMETAVVNNSAALSAFRELGAAEVRSCARAHAVFSNTVSTDVSGYVTACEETVPGGLLL